MTQVGPHNVRIRTREIIFSSADQLAYAEILARAFPDIRFLDIPSTLPKNEKPPEATVRSLAECSREEVLIVFDPAWRPAWKCDSDMPSSNRWYVRDLPLPNGSFERGRGIRRREQHKDPGDGKTPESIESGRIYFRIAANDKAQEAVARKALRLIGKVASNKNLLRIRHPSLEVIWPQMTSEWWIGFDARRWCLEKPTRSLGGMWQPGGAWAYRPVPEELVAPSAEPLGAHEAGMSPESRATGGEHKAKSAYVAPKVGSRAPSRRISERWRAWVMTSADELAYADLLAETFPGIRFVEKYIPVATKDPMPGIEPQVSLAECPAQMVHIIFDPTWEFRWRYEKCEIGGTYGRWVYGELPLPYGTIERNPFGRGEGGPRARPLDMDRISQLKEGGVYFYFERGNKEHKAIVSTALRLIGRVASMKNFVCVDAKTLNIIDSNPGSVPWIGNDARRWCLEKPDRTFGGLYIDPWSKGWRLRPKPG